MNKEDLKQVGITLLIGFLLVVVAMWLLPMIVGLPAFALPVVLLVIVILCVWHILTVIHWI